MDREISRMVALSVYANTALKGKENKFGLGELITKNSYALEFIDMPPQGVAGSARVIASNATDWIHYLKEEGTRHVRLCHKESEQEGFPDHISTAFVGGGSIWMLEVKHSDSSDLYVNQVVLANSGPRSHKTRFVRFKNTDSPSKRSSDVDLAREKLDAVLEDVARFANRHEHTKHWADIFNSARQSLQTFSPSAADEFIPEGMLSTRARQLLHAAESSWVFGGMGSWNDLAFSGEGQETYGKLTANLYSTICEAIIAGTNDSILG